MTVEITPAVITAFRENQRAFNSVTNWTDQTITDALCEGDVETANGKRWGAFDVDECRNMKRRGMFLFAAHWLATTYPNGDASMNGAVNSVVQSKSVGDESITYAVGDVAQANAGDVWLQSTSFGQQFMRLRRRAGMGAVAV